MLNNERRVPEVPTIRNRYIRKIMGIICIFKICWIFRHPTRCLIKKQKEISIETLANTSGMDYSQLARMELGQVNFTISYLFRVAEALGITPKDLLP